MQDMATITPIHLTDIRTEDELERGRLHLGNQLSGNNSRRIRSARTTTKEKLDDEEDKQETDQEIRLPFSFPPFLINNSILKPGKHPYLLRRNHSGSEQYPHSSQYSKESPSNMRSDPAVRGNPV